MTKSVIRNLAKWLPPRHRKVENFISVYQWKKQAICVTIWMILVSFPLGGCEARRVWKAILNALSLPQSPGGLSSSVKPTRAALGRPERAGKGLLVGVLCWNQGSLPLIALPHGDGPVPWYITWLEQLAYRRGTRARASSLPPIHILNRWVMSDCFGAALLGMMLEALELDCHWIPSVPSYRGIMIVDWVPSKTEQIRITQNYEQMGFYPFG